MSNVILQEYQWNPVQRGKQYDHLSGVGGNKQASTSWYNKFITNEGDRRTRLTRLNKMDTESIEIAKALDVIAEDISAVNADNEDIGYIDFESADKIKKTQLKLVSYMADIWKDRLQLEIRLFDYVRETIKYGMKVFKTNPDGTLKEFRAEQIIGYIHDEQDENEITHYIIDPDAQFLNSTENKNKRLMLNTGQEKKKDYDVYPVEDLLILKRGSGPYGESILERVFPVWRKMQLIEDSIVIYRVTRASEKRAFYVDVGRLPPSRHEEVVNKYMRKMKQRQILKNGEVDTEFDPHSAVEDFFIPTTGQGRSARIETIGSGMQLGELGDLEYFARKLAAAMRVPPSMVETHNTEHSRENYSDMRVGQVYQMEVRYMGVVKRTQKPIERAFHFHFINFLKRRDIEPPEGIEFRIGEAHSFALYKEMELNQSKLNIYNSSMQVKGLSKKRALREYLDMDEEELHDNEVEMLSELGIPLEKIKDMERPVIDNLVYGDRRLGSEFGIEPSMDRF